MTFIFIHNQDKNEVEVWAEPSCKKMNNTHIATISEPMESNPIIKWHVLFGMAGTLKMLTSFKTWKVDRE